MKIFLLLFLISFNRVYSTLSTDISTLSTDISTLSTDISTERSESDTLKQDLATLEQEIAHLLADKSTNDSIDKNGNTLLHKAVLESNIDKVKYLLNQKNIDINKPNYSGQTALYYAAHEGYLELLNILLQSGADIHHKDHQGRTALHYAKDNVIPFLIDQGARMLDSMDPSIARSRSLSPVQESK